jgi:hypothetical protein
MLNHASVNIKKGSMKFLLVLVLICSHASANTFSLEDTGARFTLLISPTELSYHSEGLSKRVQLTKCNQKLAMELNAELLSKLPSTFGSKGLTFRVDGDTFKLDPQSSLAKMLLMMDARFLSFLKEEKTACK